MAYARTAAASVEKKFTRLVADPATTLKRSSEKAVD